jgi:hypothetical protein
VLALRLRALTLLLPAVFYPGALRAQGQPQPPAPPPAQTSPAPAPQSPATQVPPVFPPRGQKPKVPDYPDPRTITVGVFYLEAIPGNGPDLIGGKAATGYETLDGFGKQHPAEGIEVFFPITRTGEIHLEGFLAKGTGSQDAPIATTVYSTSYNKGDYLSTQYQIQSAKVYLEDLLYPFKFPVAKFRLKSLWEARYIGVKGTVDAPLKPTTDSSGNAVINTGSGSNNIFFPEFGIAAEYAISPHVLLRADASGFGLPHRADLWDAEATASYRRKKWEVRAGYKADYFKTSPQRAEYNTYTLSGGFIGIRYHFE